MERYKIWRFGEVKEKESEVLFRERGWKREEKWEVEGYVRLEV